MGGNSEIQINATSHKLTQTLLDLIQLIAQMGDEYGLYKTKLEEIAQRYSQGKIHLAVLGQFKRGKSSLLNAFLGAPLLPTAVIPLTSVPTYIRYSEHPYVHVSFGNNKAGDTLSSKNPAEIQQFLSMYVSEEANPNNSLQVEGVELYYDAEILQKGVVLIDTPGIGSTHRHNTEATLNFLPQCDAALFLMSADPPITEVELEFLKQVATRVNKIFFILNKIDYLSPDELEEVQRFISRVIHDKAGIKEEITIYPVSAKQGLEAKRSKDTMLLSKSRLDYLEGHIIDFMSQKKEKVLQASIPRKSFDILTDLEMQLRLSLKAYTMPQEELQQKLMLFDETIKQAEQQKTFSGDILAGERKRLLELLEEQAENLRKKGRNYLESVANKCLYEKNTLEEEEITRALAEAIPGFFEHELGEMSRFFDTHVAQVIKTHQKRASDIIDSVRKAASDLFDIPYIPHTPITGMEVTKEPYWVMHQWRYSYMAIPEELVDKLLPKSMRIKRIKKRIDRQIHALVLNNVENLRWATVQNLDSTFRTIMLSIDEQFTHVITITRKAIDIAVQKKQTYASEVAGQIAHLEQLLSALEEHKKHIASFITNS